MKTVMDAVNEFEGDIKNSQHCSRKIEFIFESTANNSTQSKGDLVCDDNNYSPSEFREVCTIGDFNELVSQLETNFGESESYSNYKVNYEMINDDMKPVQPVFTQAMADNGELPQVGMECNFETTFFTTVTSNRGVCKPIAYHADKVWLDMFDSEYVININVIEFEPIDTRTDKEKAIDDMSKAFTCSGGFHAVLDKLIAGKIHGVKWVGE